MAQNTTLRLDRIGLKNYRCFKACCLDLHPELTVLVAENAHGKTALLHAISTSLDAIVAVLARRSQSRGFGRSDIHFIRDDNQQMVPSDKVVFEATGHLGGDDVEWCRSLSSRSAKSRSSTKDLKVVQLAAEKLLSRIDATSSSAPTTLPSVVFYGTGRLWDEHRLTQRKRLPAEEGSPRLSAYLDCLSPSSSFKVFTSWYERSATALRSATSKAFSPEERPENALAAVRKAVAVVLEPTGWMTLDWDFPTDSDDQGDSRGGELVVEHAQNGRLPLWMLSDGVRNMVALVGDLAHRCARLNPHLGENAARDTPGVLLIDEVDMHLHPGWQQLVVGLLRQTFPLMQMIFTTHSPHVLSTVDATSIRVIGLDTEGNGTAVIRDTQTQGDESGNVLARAMHVNPVPNIGPARLLSEYRGLVQGGLDQSDQAQAKWRQLVEHFGEGHHLLLEAAVLRDLQQFKRESSANERKAN